MILRYILCLLLCCISFLRSTETFAQNYQWARTFGAINYDVGYAVATDASGNVFTTGNFNGTIDFDPGSSVFSLTSFGDDDVFITKFDASGNFVWARQFGGTGHDIGYSIALDASGNIYTCGIFENNADFDPGNGTAILTTVSGAMFISKLDASGNYVWAKQIENTNPFIIKLDPSRNLYLTGCFKGTVDFDPGTGISNLSSPGQNIVFILKLNAAGNFAWAKAFTGSNIYCGFSVDIDGSGNVYSTGYFWGGGVDFDPGAGTYYMNALGGTDIYISKLDSNGGFIWARQMGGSGGDAGMGLKLDGAGNVYSTGYFNGVADFDPGSNVNNLTSAGGYDIFISKLDIAGNFVWAKQIGGSGSDMGLGIAIDASKNIYTTGYFNAIADFDPGSGVSNITSKGGNDIFISKLDSTGKYISAIQMGGDQNDQGNALTVDLSGYIYVTGQFMGTGYFNLPGTSSIVSNGGYDCFIAKYSNAINGIKASNNERAFAIYPNPANSNISILKNKNLNSPIIVNIFNMKGALMKCVTLNEDESQVSIANLVAGVYVFEILSSNFSAKQLVIIQR